MMRRSLYSLVALAVLVSAAAVTGVKSTDDCVYTLYVQTSTVIKAGTDSNISLTLGDATGQSISIPDLKNWGLMGKSHDYFEWGNLDIFTGRGPCLSGPICRLNVTSDGTGAHHGWFCDYVEVTSTGPHKKCSQTNFYVNQWLAKDAPPFQLTAVRNQCDWDGGQLKHRKTGPLDVQGASSNTIGSAIE